MPKKNPMRSHISSQQFTKEIAPSPHMRKDLIIIILENEHDEVKKYVYFRQPVWL